ncbi:MAG: hypothetical protein ACOYN4_15960 [Bacteroidales bacterium]
MIRLHMNMPGIALMLKDAENCKQSIYQRFPFSFQLCAIDENGLLQIGNLDEIRKIYSVFVSTPDQLKFFEASKVVRDGLQAMYEICQNSDRMAFRFYNPTEFLKRIDELFNSEGEEIRFQTEYLRGI